MSELTLFENPQFGKVRVIMCGSDPWFVAKDVCDCLGLGNARQAVTYLDDDEKQILTGEQFLEVKVLCTVTTNDGQENSGSPALFICPPSGLNIISESGFYSLVLRSRKPEAKAFKRWVTHEVLPAIRKTGMYTPDFTDPVAAARAWADAEEKRRLAEAEKQKAQTALIQEQSAHQQTTHKLLDAQYELDNVRNDLTALDARYDALAEIVPLEDMRSAYDMQVVLHKFFDTNKRRGSCGFWFYMSGFMHTYCHGGIRFNQIGGVDYALPGELHGQIYHMAKRDNTSVFDQRAWSDVIAYFEAHQDTLHDLPHIGYAARRSLK